MNPFEAAQSLKYMLTRPTKSHSFAVRLTVLTQISQSHGQAQNPHGKLISYKNFSLVLDHRFFHVFENKNNRNWSLIVLLMQIRKFQINAWVFLGSLPCTGCWFPSIILKLAIFRVHQKKKNYMPCFIVQLKKFIIKNFICCKHKKQ